MNSDTVKVLVVDDVHDAADTLAVTLQLDGYTVYTAYTADGRLPQCVHGGISGRVQ